MLKKMLKAMSVALLALVFMIPLSSSGNEGGKLTAKSTELRLALRDLWVGHIFWIRDVAAATKYGNSGAAKVAEEQAVQNAKDIAASIIPFYGKEAGDKLFGLLAGHYGAVKEYMNAAFAGKKEDKTASIDKLNKNADEIATFLSSANPNWPKGTLLAALAAHGGHHVMQIDAIHAKDFLAEAKVWDVMKKHIYVIADVLADGIVKQFPGKF
jgi:hypothetical protein